MWQVGGLAHAGQRLTQDLGTWLSGSFHHPLTRLLGLTPSREDAGPGGPRPVFKVQGSQEAGACKPAAASQAFLTSRQVHAHPTVSAALAVMPVEAPTGLPPLEPTLGRPVLRPPLPSWCHPRIPGGTIHTMSTPAVFSKGSRSGQVPCPQPFTVTVEPATPVPGPMLELPCFHENTT